MSIKPTKIQVAVLDYITSHVNERGFPPTVDEISERFGWASRNSAWCHLSALKAKGLISVARGKSRGISIANECKPDVEKMAQALRVISTWASFDMREDHQHRRALVPAEVLQLCTKALEGKSA